MGNVLRDHFETTYVGCNDDDTFAETPRFIDVRPTVALKDQMVCFTIRSEPYFHPLDDGFASLADGFSEQHAKVMLVRTYGAGAQVFSEAFGV
jgi:hypothetical protein